MSGPLASWVGQHSASSRAGRMVLSVYALAARWDGIGDQPLSVDDLVRLTGVKAATVRRGLAEVRQLGELVELTAVAGTAARWRIPVTLCPPAAGCADCDRLALDFEHGREDVWLECEP